MKKLFYILTSLIFIQSVYGQQQTQIIITALEKTDRTFHKKDKLFLENCVTKHQIIYVLDTNTQSLKTNKYLIETYFSIWDGDTIVKEKIKTKYKNWNNQVDSIAYIDLITSLQTDIDTLEKNMSMLHTSHHYLNIYIDIINGSDTTRYRKTKPFEYLTPWWTNSPNGAVLNPNIDSQILTLLPKEFLIRKKLILVPKLTKKS
jgi:hypothetical protein